MVMRSVGRYAIALALTLATVALRWSLNPIIGTGTVYITLFPAMIVVAVTFGVGPGLLGNVVGILLIERFLAGSTGQIPMTVSLAVRSGLLLLTTFYVGRVGERLRAARAAADEEGERLRTTLTSIGDAVVVTDDAGRVTLINKVAEDLTGWTTADASGRPL